jgi:hypothetical protein
MTICGITYKAYVEQYGIIGKPHDSPDAPQSEPLFPPQPSEKTAFDHLLKDQEEWVQRLPLLFQKKKINGLNPKIICDKADERNKEIRAFFAWCKERDAQTYLPISGCVSDHTDLSTQHKKDIEKRINALSMRVKEIRRSLSPTYYIPKCLLNGLLFVLSCINPMALYRLIFNRGKTPNIAAQIPSSPSQNQTSQPYVKVVCEARKKVMM